MAFFLAQAAGVNHLWSPTAATAGRLILLHTTNHDRYKIGQVWSYNTRQYETSSTIMIVKTERDDRQGGIIHVHIQGLRMRNPQDKLGLSSVISHLPCSEEAINESVTHVIQENSILPAFEEGYQEWREAFDAGRAGIWGIPAAKIIDAMESVLNQPHGVSNDPERGGGA